MMNLGPLELLLIVLVGLVSIVVPLLLLYWIVRLAVRHGTRDSQR